MGVVEGESKGVFLVFGVVEGWFGEEGEVGPLEKSERRSWMWMIGGERDVRPCEGLWADNMV